MSAKRQITVVCTGNTCRSPMAARLLRHALEAEPEPLRSLEVVSAGVAAFPGDPASPYSVRALRKVGLDLDDHRSRAFSPHMADQSLLILVMTESHRQILNARFPDIDTPILLFRECIPGCQDPDVPDPVGGSLQDYLETRDSLAEAIPSLIQHIKTLCNA